MSLIPNSVNDNKLTTFTLISFLITNQEIVVLLLQLTLCFINKNTRLFELSFPLHTFYFKRETQPDKTGSELSDRRKTYDLKDELSNMIRTPKVLRWSGNYYTFVNSTALSKGGSILSLIY